MQSLRIRAWRLLPLLTALPLVINARSYGQDLRSGRVPLSDGGHLAYHIRDAAGPTLVLIPGSWGDRHVYDSTLRNLDESLRIVIVEMRGHGSSWPPTLSGSMELFAEDVLRVTDHLKISSFFVGGHSIGGMIAIELAGRRPKAVKGSISIEGWTHHQVQREAFGHVTGTTRTDEQEAVRLAARARVLDRLTDEQRMAFASVWRRWDGLPILESTDVPVLELWGDRGHPRPTREKMRIPDRPEIQLEWIHGASHSLLIERPEEVADLINQFIRRINSNERTCVLQNPLHSRHRQPRRQPAAALALPLLPVGSRISFLNEDSTVRPQRFIGSCRTGLSACRVCAAFVSRSA